VEQVAAAVDLEVIDVKRAAQALDDAGLVKTDGVAESRWPLWFVGITREARERTGVWPTPESAVAGLTAAVDELLVRPGLARDDRTRVEKIRDGLTGLSRDLAVDSGQPSSPGACPSDAASSRARDPAPLGRSAHIAADADASRGVLTPSR
jgi:hypothetical protein